MYALDEADLSKRTILDCPGGLGGLDGGAIERGYDITAVDPQYNLSLADVEAKGRSEIESTLKLAESDPNHATTPAKTASLPTTKETHLSRTATGTLMGHSQVEWPTPELQNLTE
jgi:hypothetical protein